jgi:hypothetical protein
VNLSDEPQRKWKRFKPFQPVVHGPDIVLDLIDVAVDLRVLDPCFHLKKIRERRLSAFNLARQSRFLADIHQDKEIDIGNKLCDAIEPAQHKVGLGKSGLQGIVHSDLERKRGWYECLVLRLPASLHQISACSHFSTPDSETAYLRY